MAYSEDLGCGSIMVPASAVKDRTFFRPPDLDRDAVVCPKCDMRPEVRFKGQPK